MPLVLWDIIVCFPCKAPLHCDESSEHSSSWSTVFCLLDLVSDTDIIIQIHLEGQFKLPAARIICKCNRFPILGRATSLLRALGGPTAPFNVPQISIARYSMIATRSCRRYRGTLHWFDGGDRWLDRSGSRLYRH
jgi:hypothetical protein